MSDGYHPAVLPVHVTVYRSGTRVQLYSYFTMFPPHLNEYLFTALPIDGWNYYKVEDVVHVINPGNNTHLEIEIQVYPVNYH
jgi:hypothetical protein